MRPARGARWLRRPPLTRPPPRYTLAFAIISVVSTLVDKEVRRGLVDRLSARLGVPREQARAELRRDPLFDTISFLTATTANLVQLMFASLSGRYVVSLFQTARHNGGYVLFLVAAATVLLRRASQTIETGL